MKQIVAFSLLLLLSFSATQAQINIGPEKTPKTPPKGFSQGSLEALSKTQMYFVLRPEDEEYADQLTEIFDQVWTFTEGVKLITRDEFKNLEPTGEKDFSTLAIGVTSVTSQSSLATAYNFFLHLSMPGQEVPYTEKEIKKLKKQGKEQKPRYEEFTFARIELNASWDFYTEKKKLIAKAALRTDEQIPEEIVDYTWNEMMFFNWKYGYLKNALQEVNRLLKNEEPRWLLQDYQNGSALKNLRSQPIFLSENILIKTNAVTGEQNEKHDIEQLFKAYEFQYELVSDEKLNQMILDAEDPFFYLQYVQSYNLGLYSIINGQTGEIIYSTTDVGTVNIKAKRIKEISEAIEKAK
ncbi:MAG: hypothetical protein AAGH79_15130 [Bacteroidota bacterium]